MAGTSAAERKRKSRACRTEEQKLMEKEKAKEFMKNLRMKKKNDTQWKKKERQASKLRMQNMRLKQKLESSITVSSTSPKKAYSSPQSFGKALKRVKSKLPQSPRKRIAVVEKLAIDIGIPISSSRTVSEKKGIPDEVKDMVIEFYRKDEISRIYPGKKDVKSFRDPITNEKVRLQKRLLTYNLKESHEIFKVDNPNIDIGLSKFCEFRPVEVETVKSKDHEVCCCPYCENFGFLLRQCKWKDNNIKHVSDLLSLTICDQQSADCMKNRCNTCSHLFPILLDEKLASKHIEVEQWNLGKLETKTFEEAALTEELTDQFSKLTEHLYNTTRQAKELRIQKDNLKPKEILLQTDFAQNFQIKHQSEVMAAHWKSADDPSVTIYTSVVYFRRDPDGDLMKQTYAVISDTTQHSSKEVKLFNEMLIEDFEKHFNFKVEKAIIWSDGAAAHFKNRYSIASMTISSVFFQWNFSASYHGKGPHDGVGATLKRHVWKKVLQRQIVVKNAEEFFTEVNGAVSNVRCLYISEKDITEKSVELEILFKEIEPLNGIKSAHSIHRIGNMCVSMFANTGDDCPIAKDVCLTKKPTAIELEKYDAICYDDNWYLGRAIVYDAQLCTVKFLEESYRGYQWPILEDVQTVPLKFVMWEPITLIGNLPFTIDAKQRSKINKLYKTWRKNK